MVLRGRKTKAQDGMTLESGARYIAVEGPIGVGKTALARRLATEFGSELILEGVDDNQFLGKFYEDPARYALHAQLFFLLERYRQQQALDHRALAVRGAVADYLFAKDAIFAGVTLQEEELVLYRQVYQLLDAQIPKPDLVIYLEARPEILLERIKKRGREFERAIDADYLARLTEAFRSFFYDYSEAPLLVINCSDIDFVEHGGDLADLVKEIRGMKQGVQHYIPLGSR
jgi:deoxyadenosine/deoxycytidine kinase